MSPIIALVIILLAIVAIKLYQFITLRTRPKKYATRYDVKPKPNNLGKVINHSPRDPQSREQIEAPSEREYYLINLLNGDRDAALRLLKAIKAKHINSGNEWCIEKAIVDILRDRR